MACEIGLDRTAGPYVGSPQRQNLDVGAVVRSIQVDVTAGGRTETIRASEQNIDRNCVAALGRGANKRAAGQQRLARTRRRAVVWLLASAMAALGTADAFPAPRHKHLPLHRNKAAEAEHHKHRSAPEAKRSAAARQSERNRAAHVIVPSVPLPIDRPAAASLPPDLAAAKQAIELVRQRKPSEATALATSIGDPVAQKLVEWALLRHPDSEAGFERYAAFIRANPDWPSIPLLRRRAEARLWQERRDAATVRGFFGGATDQRGRPACARARADGRGRPRRRRARSSRGMAVGGTVGRTGSRDARRVPRRR